MKILFRLVITSLTIAATVTMFGCSSSQVKKTSDFTWTDRSARLMIDPNGIPAEHYAMIQDALIKADRFVVIDRPQDLDTIQKVVNTADQDVVKSRWLELSKRYDIGGIVTAHVQCFNKGSEKFCHQFMAINNTETGELVAQAEGENSAMTAVSYDYIVPDWNATANTLVEQFNKNHSKMDVRRIASETKVKVEEVKADIAKAEPAIKAVLPAKQPEAKPVETKAVEPQVEPVSKAVSIPTPEAPVTPPAIETPKAPAVTEAPKPADPAPQAKVDEPKAQPTQANEAPKAPEQAKNTPEPKPTEQPDKIAQSKPEPVKLAQEGK